MSKLTEKSVKALWIAECKRLGEENYQLRKELGDIKHAMLARREKTVCDQMAIEQKYPLIDGLGRRYAQVGWNRRAYAPCNH